MSDIHSGPVHLPRFNPDGTDYFADLRFGEFREVHNPWKQIVFDSPQGQMGCFIDVSGCSISGDYG